MSDDIKLARAVAYTHHADGRLDITLLAPWDGKPSLDGFPRDIRLAVQAQHYFFATVEESHKLWTARFISPDVHAAVWDDIMCERATQMLLARKGHDDRLVREAAIIYGDANQPTWLNKLRSNCSADTENNDDRDR